MPAYLLALTIQLVPIFAFQWKPQRFGEDYLGRRFFMFLAASEGASVLAGSVIGFAQVARLSQIPRALIPILGPAAVVVALNSQRMSDVGIYMICVYIISQSPGAILGASIEAFVRNKLALDK